MKGRQGKAKSPSIPLYERGKIWQWCKQGLPFCKKESRHVPPFVKGDNSFIPPFTKGEKSFIPPLLKGGQEAVRQLSYGCIMSKDIALATGAVARTSRALFARGRFGL